MKRIILFGIALMVTLIFLNSCSGPSGKQPDLSNAVLLVSPSIPSPVNGTAVKVVKEEIIQRTSLDVVQTENWDNKTIVALALSSDKELFGKAIPAREGNDLQELKKEGFRLFYSTEGSKKVLWIIGADARGILYGIGKFLRIAQMNEGSLILPEAVDIATSPEFPLRGHQFGYRNTANSWDAWTVEQFDQHFREQVLFGANSFENIPFQEGPPSVHMKIPREEMNIHISEICNKYDADYWIWAPADIDMKDKKLRQSVLDQHEAFYKKCPRLDGVFFPGGDPGENHPADVMPFLEELTVILHKYHPNATMWISLQGFDEEKVKYFFNYLNEKSPDWLTGVVYGPSSPPVDLERQLLPKKYKHRLYPDLTHTVRCQYPVKRWDQAFALTLGRECTNPQPLYYAEVFRKDAVFTDGFISYSDGVHDDVNKVIWSQLGWDSKTDEKQIMVEYCRFFFGNDLAETAADGILALEQNWVGPLMGNETVGKTFEYWKTLETGNPQLAGNWRWQQLVMRAYYDAFVQQRQAHERNLEKQAYKILATAGTIGADKAMEQALDVLKKAETEPVAQDLKQKVVDYCEALFQSIGLQTSVPKYNARGYERGAILDFIDYPLEEFQSCGKGFSEAAFGYWFQTKEFSLAIVPEFKEVLAFINPFRHKKISIAELAVLKKKCPPGYQLILENYAKLHPFFIEKPTLDELSAALIDTPERTRTLLTMDTLTLVYGNYEALLWCTLNQERIKQALSTIKQERLLMLMQSDELRRANDDLSRSLIRTMNEFRRHHQWRMQNRVFDAESIEGE